ncbi:MAG: ADP-forming succinate--CoA ligase subunit beta [Elusimicrobia bacterium]|jgi:succinyl-CoA synthetase beta subunit|nr:ADP-forming succinate--CoA ligase subunit beta [Elusimicrobiota bacterium]
MKLFEYEAKEIFKKSGIPVLDSALTDSPEEALSFFEKTKPVVIKSQVLSGGRGKAGGIKFASNEDEYRLAVEELIGKKIKDLTVRKVLIEKKIAIKNEIYMGYTIDRANKCITFMFSDEGGVEIETLAKVKPEAIIKEKIDILEGIDRSRMEDICSGLNYPQEIINQIVEVGLKLYQAFTEYECHVAEINPLVITEDGDVLAADARIAIYDEAIHKHPEYDKEEDTFTELEKRAHRSELGYVEMDGNVGVIGNGAGLNMATLDILLYYGGEPANFLEVSGRTYHKAAEAIDIVLSNPGVKVVFGNFFGCISRCDVIAEGLADAYREGVINVPMVVAMRGTGGSQGRETLKEAGLTEIFKDDIEAGKRLAEILKER